MRKGGRIALRTILVCLLSLVVVAAFWFGWVPQRLSPFKPLSLEEPGQWFIDARLATLRHDPPLCHAVLSAPHANARPIAPKPYQKGCGWSNGVRITSAGGAELGLDPITCEMAVAAALWVKNEVQPLALEMFGKSVDRVRDMGTYDCRNIVGNRKWAKMRSQHATANAWDIAGFRLKGGDYISVKHHWHSKGKKAEFLREVHARACKYFRVSLSPEFNRAHHDHFHFDRGALWRCK